MSCEEKILSDACFKGFLQLVHKTTGITISDNRKAMLVGRIRKRVNLLKLDGYEDYLSYVKENRTEDEHFINSVTTNETYFYRTPRVWDFITKEFLPGWPNGKRLNIWSAASSSGEEAHTLGVVCQHYKSETKGFQYKVSGTDISSDVVKRATEGTYRGRSLERFKLARPELFQKYMKGDDESGYQVLPEIKANIRFQTHNLFNTFKNNEQFDLILLRNVLIYFTKEDQQKVLANIHRCLSPTGYLIIGESETLNRLDTGFDSVSPMVYKPKMNAKIEGSM